MKQNIVMALFLSLILNIGISQSFDNVLTKHIEDEIKSINVSHQHNNQICGNLLFKDEMSKINEYIAEHPEYVKQTKSLKKPHSYTVGETKNWWVQIEPDLNGNTFEELPSTCMAVGDNCYIFVSDESWNGGKVTQDQINEIVESFDNSTPNFPNKGIYEVDVETFGTPPDFDSDERIVIFLYDIEDDFNSTGLAILGYFWGKDQFPDGDPVLGSGNDAVRSNEAEIFYIDTYPLLDENIFGVDLAISTLAHEFQHMIHYGHDNNEETFTNEGCSEIAEYVCGYGLRPNSSYAKDTNVNFLNWGLTESVIDDYQRAANWTLYLYEQYPDGILKDLVDRTHVGWGSFNSTFDDYAPIRDFWAVYEDFLIALYLNDTSFDSRYGFEYSPRTKPTPHYSHIGNMNVGETTVQMNNLGAQFLEFSNADELTVNFTNTSGILRIRAIKTGDSVNPVIEEIAIVNNSAEYTPSDFGTTYDKVALLIYNKSDVGNLEEFTYSAVGSSEPANFELAYEDGIPEGYLKWATGDSCAVIFDGIAGSKLDSVKIAFRRKGRIMVDISILDGTNFMRGNALFGPAMLTVPDSTANTDPYPNPYDNWVTIDLSGDDIDGSNDFIVSTLVGPNPAEPAVMISSEPDDGHSSRTYIKEDNQWYYVTDSGTPGNIFKYLIRAYVSIGGGATVAIDQNGIVSIPNDFSLRSNYPNPFNPSTTFNFDTPNDGLVKFTVHDLLGREIYSENRNLLAGNYSFTWNGQNNLDQQVVSGVYFLKMEADGFAQTRKMLMMK